MPVLRWHMLTIAHEQVNGSVVVTITSNAACHLYLRYSNVFPRIHRKSMVRRGLAADWDARFCFTVYQHLEQDEDGDTFTHTFTWPGWENCNTRYFYFWGTMGGQDMVSDTPIFWIHYFEAEIAYGEGETAHFFPDKHPELVTVDGETARVQYGVPWANLRNLAGTAARSEVIASNIRINSWDTPGNWYMLCRQTLLFDTSIIPPLSKIVQATLRLYGSAKINTLNLPAALNIFTSSPASNTDLIPADYQQYGDSPLAIPISHDDFLIAQYNSFFFTETGVLSIIPDGITKLAVRESNYDAPNNLPPWVSYKPWYITIVNADGDEAQRPDLEVTWQPPL